MAGRKRDRPGRTTDDEPSTVVDASLDGALEALREELEAESQVPAGPAAKSEAPTMLVRLPGHGQLAEPVMSTSRRRLDPGEAIDANPTQVRSRASRLTFAPSEEGGDRRRVGLEAAPTQSSEIPGAGPPLVRVHRFEAPVGARLDPPARRRDDTAIGPAPERDASDQLDPPSGPDDTAFSPVPNIEVPSRPPLDPPTGSDDDAVGSIPDVDAPDHSRLEPRSGSDDTAEEPVPDVAPPGRSLGSAQPSAADYPAEVLLAPEGQAPEPEPVARESTQPDPPAAPATPAPGKAKTSGFDPAPPSSLRPLFALDGADSGRAPREADREPTRGERRPETARSDPGPAGRGRLTPRPEVFSPGDLARRSESRRRDPRRLDAAAPGPARAFDPEAARGLARTSDALARIIPVLLAGIVLLATGLVFYRVFGDRAGATPHVRLELLGVPGRLPPRPDPVRTAHLIIETEPPGLVVFHEQQILGKTPCEAEIPFAMPTTVGVRLVGPRFEEWVDQVDASVSGEFRVRAKLTKR